MRAFASAWARGIGQTLFCESAGGGVLLFAGLVLALPVSGASAGVACAIATLAARVRRYPDAEWRRGLYGYAAALVGVFWTIFVGHGALESAGLVVASLATLPLTRRAHATLTPRNVPALAVAALAPVWLGILVFGFAEAPADSSLAWPIGGWTLILTGLAVYSRLLALAAIVGGVAGTVVGVLVAPALAPGMIGNAVATGAALGAVFVPLSVVSLAVAAMAASVAAGGFALMASVVPSVPPLVLPFNVVTVVALLALRARSGCLPAPLALLPLASVGHPDRACATLRARRQLQALARQARRISVLTGAGVSTAAGLPDFRGPMGLWARTRLVTLDDFLASAATRAAYWKEEDAFFRMVCRATPGSVHRALADLARRDRLAAVITQNVDGLHQAAGLADDRVIELHGNVRDAVCVDCHSAVPRAALTADGEIDLSRFYCPVCRGLLKGGGVMFGDEVSGEALDAALRAVLASDLLLVLGTSLLVAPASHIVEWARDAGIPVAIVNATTTAGDANAAVCVAIDVATAMDDVLAAMTPAHEEAAVPFTRHGGAPGARPSGDGSGAGATR
jgi:NAD-dependent deacetylase